ncbi:Dyp-type peroxidase [Actinomycetospora straminea]|uniref:Dyp-type peroxidase n=1 Tax=Actinomycetospora straminea TaxID=663607 RepID=A0ABP9EHZ5_9PSEU|nr:Dyp-type peroxidase [Actinomycetospora straminea]MDD7933750.1 Dyp-type peroxidase [Actinomycetospora straminea]
MTANPSDVLASLTEAVATPLANLEVPSATTHLPAAPVADAGPPEGAAGPAEPRYDAEAAADIQGNVVPGFNKDHQEFLFLRFGDPDGVREWLRWLHPRLASMGEVLQFRDEFRSERLRQGTRDPGMSSTWTALALSHPGIGALLGQAEADAFGEHSFRQGLAARSTYLGDPSDPARPGHRDSWVVGGPGEEADALVIVAADRDADLRTAVDDTVAEATARGLTVQFSQRGDTLPEPLQGHEHFGFKDGVSQPGVRGALAGSGLELTPRFLAADDSRSALFAKPGQPLVWPGQFLLGEPRQDPQDPLRPAAGAATFPAWARRGSYLVCRRLDQDVLGFWEFVASCADELGTSPVAFASMLVGRWPTGAPLMRSPDHDDPTLAGDEFANNHFLFDDDTRRSRLAPIPGYGGDDHRLAAADVFGRLCPHAAHIRKVNPRDSATDFGAPADTLMRLMLRRGIPYGTPIAGVAAPTPEQAAEPRGLLFAAYMSSIEDQFEFVSRRWANATTMPNLGGHDPIIGQRDAAGDRARSFTVPTPDGGTVDLTVPRDFVVPSGGGYFFAPPISAVGGVLAADR